MAQGQITIGIAGATPTTFATTPIPALVLAKVPGGESLSNRIEIGLLTPLERSTRGNLVIGGRDSAVKYAWEFSAILAEAEAMQLGALVQWQKDNPTTGLRLIDEVQYLDPVPSQSRTLLTTLNPSWNGSYVYGYGVFTVLLDMGDEWRSRFANFREGKFQLSFGAEEF